MLCVRYWTPCDGQRDSPKHVEFYSKNKFEKLVHLVGFVTRKKQKCINPLKAELNPICNLLALLGAHHILHISRIMVNFSNNDFNLHKLSHLQLR